VGKGTPLIALLNKRKGKKKERKRGDDVLVGGEISAHWFICQKGGEGKEKKRPKNHEKKGEGGLANCSYDSLKYFMPSRDTKKKGGGEG